MTFTKTNATLVRKYAIEFALIALCLVVSVLWVKLDNLNTFVRENLLQQNMNYQKTLQDNTNALNNFYFTQKNPK